MAQPLRVIKGHRQHQHRLAVAQAEAVAILGVHFAPGRPAASQRSGAPLAPLSRISPGALGLRPDPAGARPSCARSARRLEVGGLVLAQSWVSVACKNSLCGLGRGTTQMGVGRQAARAARRYAAHQVCGGSSGAACRRCSIHWPISWRYCQGTASIAANRRSVIVVAAPGRQRDLAPRCTVLHAMATSSSRPPSAGLHPARRPRGARTHHSVQLAALLAVPGPGDRAAIAAAWRQASSCAPRRAQAPAGQVEPHALVLGACGGGAARPAGRRTGCAKAARQSSGGGSGAPAQAQLAPLL